MYFSIDGTKYKIPVSLLEITLSDRIAYENTHGKELKKLLTEVLKLPEGVERDLEAATYNIEVACRTLSFFAHVPLSTVYNTNVEEVLVVYNQCMKHISHDYSFTESEFKLKQNFEWNGEQWEVAPPVLKNTSAMTAGEFVDAKEMVKSLAQLSDDGWEALHRLCCIYFRKKGEAYKPELWDAEGERYKLMLSLPLEYALQVGFFLNSSMSSYIQILTCSETSAKAA